MAYKAPSAEEISLGLRSEIRAQIPGADPFLWPNNLGIVSKVIAQALRGLYLRLEWIHRQAFASTAEGAFLERIGTDTGLARLPAAVARGTISVTATTGTMIPVGTRLLRGDGAVFLTESVATVTGASFPIVVRAETAGRTGNTDSGAALRLESPIAGVTALSVAATGVAGGSEVENDSSFRSRILFARQNPPHGGSPAEYVGWARQLSGVTRVYVQRATPQAGSVSLSFMMDDRYNDGVPLAGDVSALKTLLETLAPASAEIVVAAPMKKIVAVEVASLSPNTSAVRDAVSTEIKAMFRRRAEPGVSFSRSWISEAISSATGEVRHVLNLPAASVACAANEIAVVGAITFV